MIQHKIILFSEVALISLTDYCLSSFEPRLN